MGREVGEDLWGVGVEGRIWSNYTVVNSQRINRTLFLLNEKDNILFYSKIKILQRLDILEKGYVFSHKSSAKYP